MNTPNSFGLLDEYENDLAVCNDEAVSDELEGLPVVDLIDLDGITNSPYSEEETAEKYKDDMVNELTENELLDLMDDDTDSAFYQ